MHVGTAPLVVLITMLNTSGIRTDGSHQLYVGGQSNYQLVGTLE